MDEAWIYENVLMLKLVDVEKHVDYVRGEFERLRNDVERRMDEAVRGMEGYLG